MKRMKRVILILMAVVFISASTSTSVYAGNHCGGGHYDRTQAVNPPTISNTTTRHAEIISLSADICAVEDCMIIGEHCHQAGITVTHYYGDGHDYHDQYDHCNGSGHNYCTNSDCIYYIGEIHH
jgi:hypothetical protein